ncbi:MAG: cell division protein FtsZ [Bacteroidia bacterium]|nr:cell division protein FtsZ [Bacteroidia bacterium]NND25848.1 cell division protein FtsZ [Flavobacteriaceae bacterium]RZW56273.1 MAG: cell division protein FtsZ [Flavobacteriaceae bacterium]
MSSNNDMGNITFDLPKNQSNVIKVIGVGGGGSNAINHMFQQGIKGVDFVICNTDSQALNNSGIPIKIQLGVNLTEGLGAGANPDVGEEAAIESLDDIRAMLDTNTKMIFITAGMGGGTGTGAAPIIAKMAKELDILTVGIVTMPFQFEGKLRNAQAQQGVEKLRSHVDSLVVINNNKLREVYGNLGFKAGFSKADEVLSTAARGIAEVITHHYTQNIDLRDAKTVLSNSGTAIMGSAAASGQNRAQDAIMKALDSPLLNDNKITGAKNVLLLIVSGSQEITIDEIGEINDHIQSEAGFGANIIMGVGEDESLDEAISVTIIATGFNVDQQNDITNTEAKKVVHALEDDQIMEQDLSEKEPAIISPDIVLDDREEKPIIHTLGDDDHEDDFIELDIIPTSQLIKDMEVIYEEVVPDYNNSDFIINQVEVEVENDMEEENESKEQTMLTFDLPLSSPDIEIEEPERVEKVLFELDEEVKDISVNDYIELITVNEANDEKEAEYALDDHIMLEQTDKKLMKKETDVQVEEVVFEKKTIETEESEVEETEDLDPINSPISELLKERANERRQKMKDFNYKFNNAKIDDIEKEPAYKRQGVDLDDVQHSSENNASRLSIGPDENDDIQLRSNNSFLHDKPD